MRPPRRSFSCRHHVRSRGRRTCLAGDVPQTRHAPGRSELLRHRRSRHRAGRDLRAQPLERGHRRRSRPVWRHRRLPDRAPFTAGNRRLFLHLYRRQVRRIQQRPPRLVGAGSADQAGHLVPRIVRQPAQVRQDGPPGGPADACPHGRRRPVTGWAAGSHVTYSRSRDAARCSRSALRASRYRRCRQPRGAHRCRGLPGLPAFAGRPPRGDRDKRWRGRRADR